jgi:cbb3-type cytochrome oxidase maturation protein
MSVLFIMVPVALIIVGAAVSAFVIIARAGQYDDVDTPAYRMLEDDDGLSTHRKSFQTNAKPPLGSSKRRT